MYPEQEFKVINLNELNNQVAELNNAGYRIVQICGTKIDDNSVELIYSFDKDYQLVNFKVIVNVNEEIPSISNIYLAALLYENELHDLFGLNIKGIAIDYQGKFYKTKQEKPFMNN